MDLTGIGIWNSGLRFGDPGEALDAAVELESLGYTALWIPGGAGGEIFEACAAVLEATDDVTVATGILNLWMHTPEETAAGHAALQHAHPGRFLLGLGISHAPLIDMSDPGRYRNPLATTRAYLDALDAADPPVTAGERVLAALGPRMLELARDRTRGSHPYLVTPEHTARARAILGAGVLLAPEQAVALETDADGGPDPRPQAPADLPGLPELHEQLDAVTGSRERLSATAAATGSSTRSWRGATRRPIARARAASTTMPGPTTCASRSCPTRVHDGCRWPSGASWRPRCTTQLNAGSAPPAQASRSQVVGVTPRARSSCLRTRIDASVRGRSSTTST